MKTAIDTATSLVRIWLICLSICLVTCTCASACFNQSLSILFENVPPDIDAPVIVEVTIDDYKKNVSDAMGRLRVIMKARIDRVIKGPIDVGPLTIIFIPTACTHAGVGRGIVLGTVRDDPQHGLVLDASHYQRSDPLKWSREFSQMQSDIWNAWKSSK
jgi:hypothetical protein